MLSDAILGETPSGPVNARTDDDSSYSDSTGQDAADIGGSDTGSPDVYSQDNGSSDSDSSDAGSSDSEGGLPNINIGPVSTGDSGSSASDGSAMLSFDPADRPNANLGTGTIKELEIGDIAPDFTVDLVSGGTFTLSDHDAEVVFINFWATWCPPCVGEMPEIGELAELGLDGLQVLCINCGEDAKTVDKFVTKNDYDFNIAYDTDYTVEYYYPTDYVPYTVIIKNGIIRDIYVGAPRDAYETYKSSVENLLNE